MSGYTVRQIGIDDKISEQVSMQFLEEIYPVETIERLVQEQRASDAKERRIRDFVPRSIVYFLLAMVLWSRLSQANVWKKMVHKLQILHPAEPVQIVTGGGLSYQRAILGAEPLQQLMRQCCHPLCQPTTPGAFYRHLRVMAMDGTHFAAPDTRANDAAFGRKRNQFSSGPYPQPRCVFLLECGSHAPINVVIQPVHRAEVHGAHELLESVQEDMLVTHDCGLFGGGLWEGLRSKKAHVLCALPANVLMKRLYTLPDGSYVAWLRPHADACYRMQHAILVRVICYRLTDERLGEPDRIYRIATGLLNGRVFPAKELIDLYHERWEIEIAFDEIKTHLREAVKVLRSKTPEGVRQEIYATVLAHFAVRFLMLRAAEQAQMDPDRLSFTSAVMHIQEAIDDEMVFDLVHAPRLLAGLLRRLAAEVLPARRLRINRRELKQFYRKYKPKKRGVPPPDPFRPHERFLDFVQLVA